jgi:hypothetical protein
VDDTDSESEGLRRQQRLVGSGVAVLGSVAATAATLQQFPGQSALVYPLCGLVVAGLLFWLVSRGFVVEEP